MNTSEKIKRIDSLIGVDTGLTLINSIEHNEEILKSERYEELFDAVASMEALIFTAHPEETMMLMGGDLMEGIALLVSTVSQKMYLAGYYEGEKCQK